MTDKVQIESSQILTFVDETGYNTNQKDNGYAGGRMFVLPCDLGQQGGHNGAITDLHFTVLCFTSALRDPVLCSIILKSNKEISDIPLNWKTGIDICKNVVTGEKRINTLEENYSEGKACTGGPVCKYNDKEIPCFVGCSPKVLITLEILAEMLKLINELKVYNQSKGVQPVLVLDGHQSRMKFPFLQYINDPAHPWTVCLGVPYDTHIWQFADSLEFDLCFKIALTQAKAEYLSHCGLLQHRIKPTNIVPLVRMAWDNSFGRVKKAH
jgi:hypothetical protein